MNEQFSQTMWDELTDKFLRIKSVEQRVNKTIVEPTFEEARRSTHVQDLLAVLRERTIELEEVHRTKLKQMPGDKLPPMSDALHAADAEDFVRRAGLDD